MPFDLHWSQWVYPGPRRRFTAAEMVRAGSQRWPRSIDAYVCINVAVLFLMFSIWMSKVGQYGWAMFTVALLTLLGLLVGRWIWARPTRATYHLAVSGVALCLGIAVGIRDNLHFKAPPGVIPAVLSMTMLYATAWFFILLYRVQQIDSRLRELDDQALHLQMVRRLATAQIQPHFLFNTLASLQHWIDTGDRRGAALLKSFTRYLRATLPMFESETIALTAEVEIVRNYLEIMQARLGERLRWRIDADVDLVTLTLPPGALLTLVENSVTHGVEPSLRGGCIRVIARREGLHAVLEVIDEIVDVRPVEDWVEGIGLLNTRRRLHDQFGTAATLALALVETGMTARIDIELKEHAS